MHRPSNFRFSLLPLFAVLTAAAIATAEDTRYTLTPSEHGMVLKTPEGRTVFEYMTKRPAETELTAPSVCCLYPVYTPAGVRAVDFAPDDHRHHRGVFFAWRATTFGGQAADFWARGTEGPEEVRKIRNRAVRLVEGAGDRAVVEVENDWTIAGHVVLDERTRIVTGQQRGAYVLEFDYRLTPKVDMQLHQYGYTGFVVRARKDGQAAYFSPAGQVDLPNPHHLKPDSNWPAAPWYSYVVKLTSGETVGTAVVDHPANPPTTWHNVKSIALVNPCIVAPGPITRKPGEVIRLRYRVIVHDGPADVALLDELARSWR